MIVNQLKQQGINIFIKNAYKIAGYVRVSTEKQTKKGVSIDTQKQHIFNKLKSMEITLRVMTRERSVLCIKWKIT